MKRFIYKLRHIRDVCRTLHQKILQIDVNELRDTKFKINPYQAFFDWFLFEILQRGLVAALTFVILLKCGGWLRIALLPFALGMIRWLWLDIVGSTKEKIIGE